MRCATITPLDDSVQSQLANWTSTSPSRFTLWTELLLVSVGEGGETGTRGRDKGGVGETREEGGRRGRDKGGGREGRTTDEK